MKTRAVSLDRAVKMGSAGLVAALLMAMSTPSDAEVLKAGFLDCEVGPGVGLIVSTPQILACTFYPNIGPIEHYAGHVQKFGFNAGVSAGEVVTWAVLADQANYAPGSLAGTYAGAHAGAALGIGIGVNALFGGSNDSIVLTPISVQGGVGIGVALGITAINLERT